MKLNKLEQVKILGYDVKVIWNEQERGGWFSVNEDGVKIAVGCRLIKKSPESVYQTLLHELSELIHVILCYRYDDDGAAGDYKFFMSHKEFQNHNRILCETYHKFFK